MEEAKYRERITEGASSASSAIFLHSLFFSNLFSFYISLSIVCLLRFSSFPNFRFHADPQYPIIPSPVCVTIRE